MAGFTDGELEVMRVLWKYGEMKPGDIQAKFPREIKNPALRSYLTILLEKGHVTRRRQGKAYHYRAKTSRHSVFRSMCRQLANVFCDGSTEALLLHLIKSEKLSDDELLNLKRLADEKRQTGDKGARK